MPVVQSQIASCLHAISMPGLGCIRITFSKYLVWQLCQGRRWLWPRAVLPLLSVLFTVLCSCWCNQPDSAPNTCWSRHKGRQYICLAAAAYIQQRVQVMQSFAVAFGSSRLCAQRMPLNFLGSDEVLLIPSFCLGYLECSVKFWQSAPSIEAASICDYLPVLKYAAADQLALSVAYRPAVILRAHTMLYISVAKILTAL